MQITADRWTYKPTETADGHVRLDFERLTGSETACHSLVLKRRELIERSREIAEQVLTEINREADLDSRQFRRIAWAALVTRGLP